MELSDYPRPLGDTGIGIHWAAGPALAMGIGEVRDFWIPELKAMGVKWVKMLHIGGLDLAQLLLENDIMPIVRIYRPQPNATDPEKGTLGEKELKIVADYVAAGVRYFEFNNEPEMASEWLDREKPPNAEEVVARNAIRDMKAIIKLGGYPAVPATSVVTRWDLIGEIIVQGGRDLFDGPVWLAVHNYDLNHPLDYPYDDVNQNGTPISEEEYNSYRNVAWEGPTWGKRTREFVNKEREKRKSPGRTIFDDPSTWLGYERLAGLSRKHLGRVLPILSTENGAIVAEDTDPRYPTTTMEIHQDKTLEMARIMMGTSKKSDPAPDYYFCTAFWLIASARMGVPGWERHSWYSEAWPGGRLPTVDALKEEPKRERVVAPPPSPERGKPVVVKSGVVKGTITGGAGLQVVLRGSHWQGDMTIGSDGRFRFEGVPAGTYRISVLGTDLVRGGIEVDGIHPVEISLSLAEAEPAPEPQQEQPAPAPEPRREHPAPTPDLAPPPPQPEPEQPPPEPVAGPQWTYTVEESGPGPGFGVVRCSVEAKENVPVHLWTVGWEGMTRKSGSKREYGPYACEFAPLGPGSYYVQVAGIDLRAEVPVDGRHVVWVVFKEEGKNPSVPLTPSKPKTIFHYLLIRQVPERKEDWLALVRYVSRFTPVVGESLEEAESARYVTLLTSQTEGGDLTARLEQAGCQVCRPRPPLSRSLDAAVKSGDPFSICESVPPP